ncbi:MFS transporter, YNFM family, putative membrane transport protein [Brevibacterium antiquum]|uniref:MFS transporter, YNFM family, putative membrane transport protein n=3 Tax=Brevibacteriaceae TaxID=85019 RepID=A0A2H1KL18_9MICO|nr:MFS transporter, YNFM family, putative membrane transport protein [Brevibacterium antiquum]SMY00513.1 MFS transporter, YNFM family, putative membrane transport protein [Brevibacterium antiquum CNRZ 918]
MCAHWGFPQCRHSVGFMGTGEPSATSTRRTIVAVFLAGVSVFLVLYETQGLLPAIRGAYDIDAPTASLTVSATNVAMAVFLIPFSMLAPRIGHARQIAGGVVLAALLALILPFMPSPELLIVVRFLQGVAIAAVPATAMAYLSLRLPAAALPGAIGVYIAGNTIGGLSSRLLTGLAAEILGWHGGLAFTAAVSLVFGVIVVWLLRHDLFTTARAIAAREASATVVEPSTAKQFSAVESDTAAVADSVQPPRRAIIPLGSGLWRIYLTGFLCMIVFGGSFTMLGTRLQHDPWRLSEGAVALFFLIYLVGTLVTTYYGRLATKLSRTSLTLIGMVTALVGAGLTLVNSLPVIIIGMSLLTGGFFLGHTGASASASASRPGVDSTRSAAIYLTVYYLGTSLGAWLSAVLFTGFAWPGVVVMCMTSLLAVLILTLSGASIGFKKRS